MAGATMKVLPQTFQVLWEASEHWDSPAKPSKKAGPIFLRFTDFGEEDMAQLANASSKAEMKQLLKECLAIDQSEGFRTEILVDMHYHTYSFCMKCGFTPDKTSTLLSIMKVTLNEAVASRLPVEEAFPVFKNWLLKHSVERPPWSVGVYAFEDVKRILEYVHNTFFRHYRLYQYVYMTHCELDFSIDARELHVVAPAARPAPLRAFLEQQDPKSQPEFAHLFKPSEQELAEATLRQLNDRDKPEDRATVIKRKVDEGVQKLMQQFEGKLKEQDARFQSMLQAK